MPGAYVYRKDAKKASKVDVKKEAAMGLLKDAVKGIKAKKSVKKFAKREANEKMAQEMTSRKFKCGGKLKK